jgi:hypothetical protein
MPCHDVKLPGGGAAFVRTSGHRTPKCQFCKERPGVKQCDYPIGAGRTCDASVCTECALHLEPDNDYCPIHKEKVFPVPATCVECGQQYEAYSYSRAVTHKSIKCTDCRKGN